MGNDLTQNNYAKKDRSLTATGIVIAVIVILLVSAFFSINSVLRQRSLSRVEEGADTVIEEVTSKLARDSRILNAAAEIISQADNFDPEATREVMMTLAPLLETMQIRVLMPDDSLLTLGETVINPTDGSGISFAEEAPLGEHVSNRQKSLTSGKPVLRHYVPIVQNGQVAALLYGVTELSTLENSLNIDNIYNASASVYIIDARTGDFILDTWHDELLNIADYDGSDRETKGDTTWDDYLDDLTSLESGYVVFRTSRMDDWEYMYYAPAGINEWSIAVSEPDSR